MPLVGSQLPDLPKKLLENFTKEEIEALKEDEETYRLFLDLDEAEQEFILEMSREVKEIAKYKELWDFLEEFDKLMGEEDIDIDFDELVEIHDKHTNNLFIY